MKKLFLQFVLSILYFIHPLSGSTQTANIQDSLALVDLFNSTNGNNWTIRTNWLSTAPLKTWYGIYLSGDRVATVKLQANKLTGTLPSSLGTLTNLQVLDLHSNELIGNIPASLGNISNAWQIDLSYNQLSGSIPPSLIYPYPSGPQLNFSYNRFTFSGMEELISNGPINVIYFPQADIPLIQNANILSVAAGGTKANNMYRWYKDNALVSTKIGDSTFTVQTSGNYSVEVSNSKAQALKLYSITPTTSQDSLALLALYNSAGGANWTKNKNWLSTAPVATWYGVTVRQGKLTQLELPSNNLVGSIPTSLGDISNLIKLDLNSNQLNGTIPSSLDNLTKLQYLHLHRNQLSGAIPSFTNLTSLIEMRLNNNELSGSIPTTLGNLLGLGVLMLDNNQINGSIPSELGNLPNLLFLHLNNNQLSGIIPKTIGNISRLAGFYADNNQLTGSIPASIGKLRSLNTINLSNNKLSGIIPDSIYYAQNVNALILSNNQLSGTISDSISKLRMLSNLHLDNNLLSGNISSLSKLSRLFELKLENNKFTFNGMENLPTTFGPKSYAPQAKVPIIRSGSSLTVSANGTVSNNTYKLYKDGSLFATQTGDSMFTISGRGVYYITVNNAIATQLTLESENTTFSTMLVDTTTTISHLIVGTAPVDINDGNLRLATLTPIAGSNALHGNVTTIVTIDETVKTYNDLPYVQRHYDINPTSNASTAQATITLYYTQQDFDIYNTYVTSNNLNIPLLPSGGVDNGNIRISQLHGSFTGSSNPANYSGSTVVIVPSVVWDASNSWWTVTFSVNGFSGFYLSTINIALPLTLLEFKANTNKQSVDLQWLTSNEMHTKHFEVERSNNGNTFERIGKITAHSTSGTHLYTFTDANPQTGNNIYRLKMVDQDEKYTYSRSINVQFGNVQLAFTTYPNPSQNSTSAIFTATAVEKYNIEIANLSGQIVKRLSGKSVIGVNKVDLDMHNYSNGIYTITLVNAEQGKRSVKLVKQ